MYCPPHSFYARKSLAAGHYTYELRFEDVLAHSQGIPLYITTVEETSYVVWETLHSGISSSWGCHSFLPKIPLDHALHCKRSCSHGCYSWGEPWPSIVATPHSYTWWRRCCQGITPWQQTHSPMHRVLIKFASSFIHMKIECCNAWNHRMPPHGPIIMVGQSKAVIFFFAGTLQNMILSCVYV
jgi:hypothetical protein